MANPYGNTNNGGSSISLQKKRNSSLVKRRSVSGPLTSSHAKGIRRLSLQFSSSVSSLISFTSHASESHESHVSHTMQAPAKTSLNSSYLQSDVVNLSGLEVKVPQFTKKCCDFILQHGITEGIFRMNGSIRNVSSIERAITSEETCQWQFAFARDAQNVESTQCNNVASSTSDYNSSHHEFFVTPHDTATLLKRWISRIKGGLITPEVNKEIRNIQKESDIKKNQEHSVTPTETPLTSKPPQFETPTQTTFPIDCEDSWLRTPTDEKFGELPNFDTHSENDDTIRSLPKRSSSRIPELYSEQIAKLPIQNIHLLLYLLNFFSKLSRNDNSHKTRMDSSNIAKMLQLSIFSTDDHIPNSQESVLYGSLESFSELKNIYDSCEKILENWIDYYDVLFAKLEPTIVTRREEMSAFLNGKNVLTPETIIKPKVVRKMASNESIVSILSSDNEDHNLNANVHFNNHHSYQSPNLSNIKQAIRINTFVPSEESDGKETNLLALIVSNDSSNGSIVHTPVDLKNKLSHNELQDFDNIKQDSSHHLDTVSNFERKKVATSGKSNDTKKIPENIQKNKNKNKLNSNKHKPGIGLMFKGMFKRKPSVDATNEPNNSTKFPIADDETKGDPSSTSNNTITNHKINSELKIRKKSENSRSGINNSTDEVYIKKEKRKSSFNFLLR